MTPEELAAMAAHGRAAMDRYEHRFHVCAATACHSAGSDGVHGALAQLVRERGLDGRCTVKSVGCRGLCTAGPMVSVEPEGILYEHVSVQDAPDLMDSLGNKPVERIRTRTDIPFF